MAMAQAGMGLTRVVVLVGAGVAGSIVLRNGRLSEILGELQRELLLVTEHRSKISSKYRALNVLLVSGDCILVGLQVMITELDDHYLKFIMQGQSFPSRLQGSTVAPIWDLGTSYDR